MIDDSWSAITAHWGAVVADLAEFFGVDLFDPDVQGRPWLGVRTMIYALLTDPRSRLRRALPRR